MKKYIQLFLIYILFQSCSVIMGVGYLGREKTDFRRKKSDIEGFITISSKNDNIKSSFLVPKSFRVTSSFGGVITASSKVFDTIRGYYPYELSITYKPIKRFLDKEILGKEYTSGNHMDSILKYYLKRYEPHKLSKKDTINEDYFDGYKVTKHRKITIGGLSAREFTVSYTGYKNINQQFTRVIAPMGERIYLLCVYYNLEIEDEALKKFEVMKQSFKPLL